MFLKIQKYDMIVTDVAKLELSPVGSPIANENGDLFQRVCYRLLKEDGRVVWSENLDLPMDIYLVGNKFVANKQTQTDVNKLNTFFTAIGAPEIVVLKDQSEPVVEETPTEE